MAKPTSTPMSCTSEPVALQRLPARSRPLPWHRFDVPIAPGGYHWWYVDALSDDRQHGLTIIVMLGSVFSPYYAATRRRHAGADPLDHAALNVALYGTPARWALTERPRSAVRREADALQIGPSGVHWNGDALEIHVNERSAPLARPLQGTVRVRPLACGEEVVQLDAGGAHHWWPVSPTSEVEVAFTRPALRWHGIGYLDSNFGTEPLETGFRRWDWARSHGSADATTILYNVETRDAGQRSLAITVDRQGRFEELPLLRPAQARRGFWGVARPTRADRDATPEVSQVLEDTPFYTRSVLNTRLYGQALPVMHESLDLDRFSARWVQALIPFRNPRR